MIAKFTIYTNNEILGVIRRPQPAFPKGLNGFMNTGNREPCYKETFCPTDTKIKHKNVRFLQEKRRFSLAPNYLQGGSEAPPYTQQ